MTASLGFDLDGMRALAMTRREYLSRNDLDTMLDAIPVLIDAYQHLLHPAQGDEVTLRSRLDMMIDVAHAAHDRAVDAEAALNENRLALHEALAAMNEHVAWFKRRAEEADAAAAEARVVADGLSYEKAGLEVELAQLRNAAKAVDE